MNQNTLCYFILFIFGASYEALAMDSFGFRTGREYCWIKYSLPNNTSSIENKKINHINFDQSFYCISRIDWMKWLSSSYSSDWTENGQSRWKISSPLLNSIEPKKDKNNKKIFLTKNPILIGKKNSFQHFFIKKVEKIREYISTSLQKYDSTGIFRSLIIHEAPNQSSISLLRKLGFVHLATVSGIHLYVIGDICIRITQFFCYHLKIPIAFGIQISRICSFFICLLIWLLSGARLGMLRPWLILLLRQGAQILGFRWKKLIPLLLALFIDLVLAHIRAQMGYIEYFSSGRWIYTLAVGGGLIWAKQFHFHHLGLAIGSWIGVSIWEVWHTGTISLGTPLISLISLPIVCLWIYPLVLLGILLKALYFFSLSNYLLSWTDFLFVHFISILREISLIKGNLWILSKRDLLFGFALSSLVAIFLPSIFQFKNKKRTFSILLFILILRITLNTEKLKNKDLIQIDQLDVGQGDSALIQYKGIGLIDVGSEKSISPSDWIQIFAERKITKVDWVALTHLDEDHQGGLKVIADLLPVQCVSVPNQEIDTQKGKKLINFLSEHSILLKKWNEPCIPFPKFQTFSVKKNKKIKSNEIMGAILIPFGKSDFYLNSGDLPKEFEPSLMLWLDQQFKSYEILNKNKFFLANRILKVSHHGSKTSTTFELLKKLKPTQAWISSGQGNRYHHPSLEVLDKFTKLEIPVFRTDLRGNLSIKILNNE